MIRSDLGNRQLLPAYHNSVGWLVLLFALGTCAVAGCGNSKATYKPNDLRAASLTREGSDLEPRGVAKAASALVEQWFGSLDAPRWPSEILGGELEAVRMDSVNRCAGPVGRGVDKVERGVYRKHCVSCHGLSGDGLGAAAMLLEPYPRDFRRGTFKFKSTPIGKKPTREDIHRTLYEGIPGTSMPSFRALEESKEFADDIDDLVEYVRFLAIRGEVERRIIALHVREGVALDETSEQLREVVRQVVEKWSSASSDQVTVPESPEFIHSPIKNPQEHSELMQKGKSHFESELTACVKCHGTSGAGDGTSQDYDEWTKDWTILAGIDPKHPSDWKEMKPFGALKPVLTKPRNFHWGAYHGGKSPSEIFKRIVLGIEGTPMPPVARAQNGNPGLTDQELWELVYYVMHLEDRS
jgi:mono/diheme cytochrome c family protein